MADKYKHLEDGAEFTADTVNDRFETAFARVDPDFPMPARAGIVNLLDKEDLASGSLRNTQLPGLIGPAGTPMTDMRFTQNNPIRFGLAVNISYATRLDFNPIQHGGETLYQMDIPSVDLLDFDTSRVSAIIVLANICVERFVIAPDQGYSAGINEDTYAAEFILSVRQEGSADYFQIDRSWRFVSPRITINTRAAFTSSSDESMGIYAGLQSDTGASAHFDDDTSQDVPIRIVLRKADIEKSPRTTAIDSIRLEARCRVDGADSTSSLATAPAYFQVSKGNLTAIPIHAKV
jgi:hypothetical protein